MDILFISPQNELVLKKEINGILLLSTILKQNNFDVDILRFCEIEGFSYDYEKFIDNIVSAILNTSTRVVSLYSLWPDYHIVLRIANKIKKKNSSIITVLGGPQPSATAIATMEAMPFIDYICTGEGELTAVPFFSELLNKKDPNFENIPGLIFRKDNLIVQNKISHPFCNLNTLPFWDDSLYLKHYTQEGLDFTSTNYYMPIDAGRGCPFNCSFCSSSILWKRAYRMKNAERIIQEIKHLNSKLGIKSFLFSHDALTVNKKLIHELCDKIIEEKLDISWKCDSRVDCIDEALITKMKRAGLREIELGVETGSAKMQKIINKKLDLTKTIRTIEFLQANEIKVNLFFMYGFPDENEEDLYETLDLQFRLLDMGVQYTSMSLCRFNPLTKFTNQYYDDLVFEPDKKNIFRGVFGISNEIEWVKQNKSIFINYYHLNTPIRNNYTYLIYLLYIYRKHPVSAKAIKDLFNNHLELYQKFYTSNAHIFALNIEEIENNILNNSDKLIKNMLIENTEKWIDLLYEVYRFEENCDKTSKKEKDYSKIEVYKFNFSDYKNRIPISAYTPGETIILHQKSNNQAITKVLHHK